MHEKLAAVEPRSSWWKPYIPALPPITIPALATALVLILATTLTFTRGPRGTENLPPEEKVLLEVLPIVQNLEFFESMQYLEAIDIPEDPREGHNGSA
jgi:hypothetical protein